MTAPSARRARSGIWSSIGRPSIRSSRHTRQASTIAQRSAASPRTPSRYDSSHHGPCGSALYACPPRRHDRDANFALRPSSPLRSLSQLTSRELGPHGSHVAHVPIGLIENANALISEVRTRSQPCANQSPLAGAGEFGKMFSDA